MTENKPIMIDGVDVSGCKYLYIVFPDNKLDNESGCYAESERCVKMTRCKNCHNCYFKQLARKKQECEIWKNQVLTIDDEIITVQITQQQFEEYNQLKEDNDTLRQFLSKEPLALQALQSGYASYKKSSDVFYEMVKQYKQTITEIKEIAEKRNYLDYNECLDDILQKISECEVRNERN